jgi:hypothetical protein
VESLCRHGVELVEGLLSSDGFLRIEKNGWIKDAKDQDCNGDANAIKTNKVSFRLEQVSLPTLEKLDRSVDASNVDEDDRNDGGVYGKTLPLCERKTTSSLDEDGEETAEDGHEDELEDDTSNHQSGARFGVFTLVGGTRSEATTASLNEKGDDIDDEEDPEVKFRTDDGVLRTDGSDEISESDVDGSSNKDWTDNEGCDLQKKGNLVVGTFVGPRATNPSHKLNVRRDGQEVRRGFALLEWANNVVDASTSKDKIKDDTGCEAGDVSVGVFKAWDKGFAAVEEVTPSVITVRYRHFLFVLSCDYDDEWDDDVDGWGERERGKRETGLSGKFEE